MIYKVLLPGRCRDHNRPPWHTWNSQSAYKW